MGRMRARYNEKARSASTNPNQQLHPNPRNGGIRALKMKFSTVTTHSDVKLGGERDAHIRQVLDIPTDVKLSNQKRKRMQKFIDKQLKKEQRVELMQSLEQSSICSS